jgi:hypothetical protein
VKYRQQGVIARLFNNAKGKNKLQRQEALQGDRVRRDHLPESFQTSHSYKEINQA